jgi:GTPase SAR1 family protein
MPPLPEEWNTLYLWGASGTGKTSLARTLLPGASLIRHRNQLVGADFNGGLIFDDFDVSHWPPTAVIHLVDSEVESGIDVKHGHEVIPANTKKIITMNIPLIQWVPPNASPEQIEAIRRRIVEIEINEKLY